LRHREIADALSAAEAVVRSLRASPVNERRKDARIDIKTVDAPAFGNRESDSRRL
jgi:hypothetical protein